MNMTDKVVIVTGASTLMGYTVARLFAEKGASVIMADINDEGMKHALDIGDKATYKHTDVTQDEDIDACLRLCVEKFGRLDYLVNLACTYSDNGIASTRAEWLNALNVNLVGSAIFIQKATPMLSQSKGSVVNIASISGKRAQPGRMLYAVSKAAILHMTRTAALALSPEGIRINSVSPGWTWSNIMFELTQDNRAKADGVAAPFHVLDRMGDPEEVARAVLFLCSEDASFITAADLAVDGGYTAIGPEQKADSVSKLSQ